MLALLMCAFKLDPARHAPCASPDSLLIRSGHAIIVLVEKELPASQPPGSDFQGIRPIIGMVQMRQRRVVNYAEPRGIDG